MKKTIYETGSKEEIALFEIMKNNPDVVKASVRRIQRGQHKGEMYVEVVYKKNKQEEV